MISLADRIRAEADIADRPGQLARLEAIADEVARLTATLAAANAEAADFAAHVQAHRESDGCMTCAVLFTARQARLAQTGDDRG